MGGEVSANLREQVLVVVKRASFEFGEDVAHALQSVSETAQRVERGALYVHAEQVKAGESLGVAIVVEPDGLHFGDALLIATMIIVAGAEAGRRTGIVELGAIHRRGALNRVKGDSSRGVPNGFLHEADTVCRGV